MYIACGGRRRYALTDSKRYLVLDTDTCEVEEMFGAQLSEAFMMGFDIPNLEFHYRPRTGVKFVYLASVIPKDTLIQLNKWDCILFYNTKVKVFYVYSGGVLFTIPNIQDLGVFLPSNWGVLTFEGLYFRDLNRKYVQRKVTFTLTDCTEQLILQGGYRLCGEKMTYEQAISKVMLDTI